jgi:hypothetical protein
MPINIVRIDEWNMRQIFNDGRFWERAQTGELAINVRRNTHPSRTVANEPFCTHTQEISYIDANGQEVARIHQYLRPDGSIGASGRPDPKRVLIGDTLYRLHKNPQGN